MKTGTGKVGDSYLELIHRFPLKAIDSQTELTAALGLIDELMDNSRLDHGQRMYLDALATLVQSYETARYRMPKINPIDAIRFLMEQHDKTRTDLVRDCDIDKTTVSMLLSGHRELSKAHVRKLADYFHVSTDVFM